MIFTNLDIISRRYLLEKGLPIHYYPEALFHSSSCLRELTFDTLKIVNTRDLPVDNTGAIDLPDDFADDVMLAFNTGATLQPIPHRDTINPLRVHNATTGEFEKQSTNIGLHPDGLFFPFVGWTWYWNMSDYGEPTGRLFGANGGNPRGYKVIRERRQIQVYGGNETHMVLQYISDGQSVDAATMVDVQAFATIQAYIVWKRSPNPDNEFSPEGRLYLNQKRKLRARLNGLTTEDVKNIIRGGYTAAIKN